MGKQSQKSPLKLRKAGGGGGLHYVNHKNINVLHSEDSYLHISCQSLNRQNIYIKKFRILNFKGAV